MEEATSGARKSQGVQSETLALSDRGRGRQLPEMSLLEARIDE